MTDHVTDEMVETAVTAVWNSDMHDPDTYVWDTLPMTDESRELWLRDVRTALNAAAPAIAEATLRDAADGVDLSPSYPTPGLSELHNAEGAAEAFLRARADQIKKEDA